MVIVSVEFQKPSWIPLIVCAIRKIFSCFPVSIKDDESNQYAHRPSWKYKMVHSITGDEFIKTQSEVDEFQAEVKKD